MNARFNPPAKSRMAGVGMLEVLVALLVLSIGVLGMSQLQGVATRQNYNGYLRSQATFLALSVADRMRSNQKNAEDYAMGMDADAPSGSDLDRAEKDVKDWLDNVAQLLPAGDGEIEKANNDVKVNGVKQTFDTYTITVRYDIAAQYDSEDDDHDGEAESTDDDGLATVEVAVETEVAS